MGSLVSDPHRNWLADITMNYLSQLILYCAFDEEENPLCRHQPHLEQYGGSRSSRGLFVNTYLSAVRCLLSAEVLIGEII